MEEEKRPAKLRKLKQWHKKGNQNGVIAGAPLLICPSAGDSVSKQMKKVCTRFRREHNFLWVCMNVGEPKLLT